MNYRDMLLADYFDEDYDYFDEEYLLEENENKSNKFKDAMKKVGSGSMTFIRGDKDSSRLNKGLQIGGTAAIGAGAGAAAAGLAALNHFNKHCDEIWEQEKRAGKTKGLTKEQWKAKKVKALKATIGAGAGAAVLGGAVKAGTYGFRKHGNKKLTESFDMDDFEEVYIENMYDIEADIYAGAIAEALDTFNSEGYFDEGYEDVAVIEALKYADSLMLYAEADTTAAADIKCAFLESGDIEEAYYTAQIISESRDTKDKTAESTETAIVPNAQSEGGSNSKDKVKFTQRMKGWGKNAVGIKNGRTKKRTAGIIGAQVGAAGGAATAGVAAIKLAKLKKALKNGQISRAEYEKQSKPLKIMIAAGSGAAVAGTAGSVVLRHTGSGKSSWKKTTNANAQQQQAVAEAYLEDLNTTLYYDSLY